MKTRLLILLSIIYSFSLFAQKEKQTPQTYGFSEIQSVVNPKNKTADLRFLSWYSVTRPNKIGFWAFGLFAQEIFSQYTFGEGVLGINYTHKKSEFGIGGGFETAEKPWRTSAYIYTGKGEMSFYANAEYGGSGYWHLAFLNYQATKKFGIGFVSQMHAVHGLRVQYAHKKFLTWTGLGVDESGKPSFMIGARLHY